MRHTRLWAIWIIWALGLIAYCSGLRPSSALFLLQHYSLPFTFLLLLTLLLFCYPAPMRKMMMKIFQKKNALSVNEKSADVVNSDEAPLPLAVAPTVMVQPAAKAVVECELSTVAVGCCVKGDITIQGDIQISGAVEGNITCAKRVRVLKTGQVKGEIRAPTIVIDGAVIGTCCGETIEILENGRMEGVVQTNDFAISRQGQFIGISERYPAEEKERTSMRGKNKDEAKQPICA